MLKLVERFASGVFRPEEIAILVGAFDEAWDRLLKSGARYGSEYSIERARAELGRSIIEAAKLGERDPHRLCEDAFLFMTKSSLQQAAPNGPMVDALTADDCRNYALECVRLADTTPSQTDKETLLRMAAQWGDAARVVERSSAMHEKSRIPE